MGSRSLKPKVAYKAHARLEVFYTGGPVSVSGSGVLACACSDEVKVDHSSHVMLSIASTSFSNGKRETRLIRHTQRLSFSP